MAKTMESWIEKLAPYGTDGRFFKSPAHSNLHIVPWFKNRGQLPAAMVNGRGDNF